MSVVLCAAGFLLWFAAVEGVTRRLRVAREASRKFVHLTSGLGAAAMPLVLTFHEIVGLGILFATVLGVSQRFGILRSVHEVDRATWGEVCLPLGVAATAAIAPQPAAYACSVATVAISDVAACLAGQRLGTTPRSLPGGTKTVAGSAAFLAAALAIGLVSLAVLPGAPLSLARLLMAGALTTLVEALAPRGLDNVAIPVTAAAVLVAW